MQGFWGALKRIWRAWEHTARKIGTFQARVLLTLLYGILVLPFGLMVRWMSDPLRIKKRPTEWLDYTDSVNDMQWAKKQ